MAAGTEIERKFLVRDAPADLDRHPADAIEQGYLAITPDGVEVRVRERAGRAFLTIKSGSGLTRVEEEIEIDRRRLEALWPLTEGRRVSKTRFVLSADDGLRIELDVYRGDLDGLVTAEVEFASEAQSRAFQPPSWLGDEITDDPRHKNQSLALHGLPR
jgi:adenylate cyclase